MLTNYFTSIFLLIDKLSFRANMTALIEKRRREEIEMIRQNRLTQLALLKEKYNIQDEFSTRFAWSVIGIIASLFLFTFLIDLHTCLCMRNLKFKTNQDKNIQKFGKKSNKIEPIRSKEDQLRREFYMRKVDELQRIRNMQLNSHSKLIIKAKQHQLK